MSINLIPLIAGGTGLLAAFIIFRAMMSFAAMEGNPQKLAC